MHKLYNSKTVSRKQRSPIVVQSFFVSWKWVLNIRNVEYFILRVVNTLIAQYCLQLLSVLMVVIGWYKCIFAIILISQRTHIEMSTYYIVCRADIRLGYLIIRDEVFLLLKLKQSNRLLYTVVWADYIFKNRNRKSNFFTCLLQQFPCHLRTYIKMYIHIYIYIYIYILY